MRAKRNSGGWARRFTALAALILLVAAVDPDEGSPAQVAQARYEAAMGVLDGSGTPDDFLYAIDLLSAAIVLDPDWPEPFYSLGVAYAKLGLYAEAADSLRTYLELKPGARDAAAVNGMIAVLDAKARRGIDRALVIETFASLGDSKTWRRTSPEDGVAWFMPAFRAGTQGLEAEFEVDTRTHARNFVTIPIEDQTRNFDLRYFVSNHAAPAEGYTCGGRALCDYRVTVEAEFVTPRLVLLRVMSEAIYDTGPSLIDSVSYLYFQP